MKVTVLGGGRVGSAIAQDLSTDFDVTVSDSRPMKIPSVKTRIARLSYDWRVQEELEDTKPDIVVNALPSELGYDVLAMIIELGYDVVDITFMKENPLLLDGIANKFGVTAVVDCGVAPGLTNMILGSHIREMDVEIYEAHVGGLPLEPVAPWYYRAPFAPSDVIEEYTRPVRMRVAGKDVLEAPLSDLEARWEPLTGVWPNISYPLVSFNTDGLRTLLETMPFVDTMVEKTIRYAEHYNAIKLLSDTGLLEEDSVQIVSEKLKAQWEFKPGERDVTLLHVVVKGTRHGRPITHIYDMYDEHDGTFSSMARTTGFTATAVVRAMADGHITQKGVIPPERIGANELAFPIVLGHLKDRGIVLPHKVLPE